MEQQLEVDAPSGQAGGQALEKNLGLDVMDAGVAVTWCIPEDISLRGRSAIGAIPA